MAVCPPPSEAAPRCNLVIQDKNGVVACYFNALIETHVSALGDNYGMNVIVLEYDEPVLRRAAD